MSPIGILICTHLARTRLREDRERVVVHIARMAAALVRVALHVHDIWVVRVAQVAQADEWTVEANFRPVAFVLLKMRWRAGMRLDRALAPQQPAPLREQGVVIPDPHIVHSSVDHFLRCLLVSFLPLASLRAAIDVAAADYHRIEVVRLIVQFIALQCVLLRPFLDVWCLRLGQTNCRLPQLIGLVGLLVGRGLLGLVVIALQKCQVKV